MIPPQLLGIASKIGLKGFAMIGMGLALAFMFWRADALSNARDAALERVGAERVAHAVTTASYELLKVKIAQLNAEANARADAFADSTELAAREALEHDREARASQGQIDRLRALAAAGGTCAVPGELATELEGL